jgi:hypothetical protein
VDSDKSTVLKVKPALNVRTYEPRVCGTCRYLGFPGDGTVECMRPEGPLFDAGDFLWHTTTCDRWVKYQAPDPADRAGKER